MATLDIIEDFLDIEIGDKILCDGKKRPTKNQYYYFRNQYYIIKLTKETWMIADDSRETRNLMKNNVFCVTHDGYTLTVKDGVHTGFHRLRVNCRHGFVVDHINRKTFDNRVTNLREVTQQINMRNTMQNTNNVSGKKGVIRCVMNGLEYWKAYITDNEGKLRIKNYSIKKHTENKAKRMAIHKRKEFENLFGYICD